MAAAAIRQDNFYALSFSIVGLFSPSESPDARRSIPGTESATNNWINRHQLFEIKMLGESGEKNDRLAVAKPWTSARISQDTSWRRKTGAAGEKPDGKFGTAVDTLDQKIRRRKKKEKEPRRRRLISGIPAQLLPREPARSVRINSVIPLLVFDENTRPVCYFPKEAAEYN